MIHQKNLQRAVTAISYQKLYYRFKFEILYNIISILEKCTLYTSTMHEKLYIFYNNVNVAFLIFQTLMFQMVMQIILSIISNTILICLERLFDKKKKC